jgi:hypothetical protein
MAPRTLPGLIALRAAVVALGDAAGSRRHHRGH